MRKHRRGTAALALGTLLLAGTDLAGQNVLLIVADDLGLDHIGAYTPGINYTPNIDLLASAGVRFDNCWGSGVCSPSRACFHTGKYPIRSGVRRVIQSTTPTSPEHPLAQYGITLQRSLTTLPELLNEAAPLYKNILIGKWHLDHAGAGLWGPGYHGWQEYWGFMAPKYFNWTLWTQVLDHALVNTMTTLPYNTTDVVNKARDWINAQPVDTPWFCCLTLLAPHFPVHCPPASALPTTPVAPCPAEAPFTPGCTDVRPRFRAMVESLDHEIGRLLSQLNPTALATTDIIFCADNGTDNGASEPPNYVPLNPPTPLSGCPRGKGTPYQGGVHVPLIVCGPSVTKAPGSDVDALVHLVDLFATVADLCGVTPPPGTDSIKLTPFLQQGEPGVVYRDLVFTDQGPYETGSVPPVLGEAPCRELRDGQHWGFCEVRGGRYKLIRYAFAPIPPPFCSPSVVGTTPLAREIMFDLVADPTESNPLTIPGHPSYQAFANQLNVYCPPLP